MQNSNEFENQILDWIQKKKRIERTLSASPVGEPLIEGSDFGRVLKHLDFFIDNVSYLNSRRSKGGLFLVKNEADVQDLLYVMLKPSFPNLTFEDPSHKVAASYPIKDLYFPLSKMVLEAKYIDVSKDVKQIEKQLHDDIMKYSATADCETIIFFIYDPNYSIPDRRNFIQKMSQEKGKFMRDGREVIITTIIKP